MTVTSAEPPPPVYPPVYPPNPPVYPPNPPVYPPVPPLPNTGVSTLLIQSAGFGLLMLIGGAVLLLGTRRRTRNPR